MYKKIKNIHFIGVGGIGMSGLAHLLINQGYQVSGSDLSQNETVKNLESRGMRFFKGHDAKNVEGVELVVFSSAITRENPELKKAKELEIVTIPRAEMLAELMRLKYGIAVAGAHGKTTTTSMVAMSLIAGKLDPQVIVGGKVDPLGGQNARPGDGEFMIVEADESDGSFNKLSPSIAVVTNLDREHMDFFKTMTQVKEAFLQFLNKVPFYGLSIFCGDDPVLNLLAQQVTRRKKSYGFQEHNDYQIVEYQVVQGFTFCKVSDGKEVFEMKLQVPGRHNALNALASLIIADELSIPRNTALEALSQFNGVRRRFQKRGEIKGVSLIDDYAHHPTEIKATLKAARERFPDSSIKVIFQPHRYSRIADLFEEFPQAFEDCDQVAITDIYAAGEEKIQGVSTQSLLQLFEQKSKNKASLAPTPLTTLNEWVEQSHPGDVILTLGAGDLPNVYQQLGLN